MQKLFLFSILFFFTPVTLIWSASMTSQRTSVHLSGLSVAVLQMCSSNNKALNLKKTACLVAKAVLESPQKLQMVFMPECCAFMGYTRLETLAAAEAVENLEPCLLQNIFDDNEDSGDSVVASSTSTGGDSSIGCINYVNGLRAIAARHKLWLSVGGFPEKTTQPDDPTQEGVHNTHL
jgi:hypothetical protein